MGNNPINFNDPDGLFVTQVVGGIFNAAVGAAVTYSTGGATWQQYMRNAAIDFGVGAASSGVAGLSKVATLANVAGATNNWAAKGFSAFSAEMYKGYADNKNPAETGVTAVTAGALNATGIVGKGAGWVAQKIGAVTDGFTPNPNVAALLQPKAVSPTAPAVAAGITESIGAFPNYGIGMGVGKLSSFLSSSDSSAAGIPRK